MYAPKFKSWMTDDERFYAALDARIAPMIESARVECAEMVARAEGDLGLRQPKAQDAALDLAGIYNSQIGTAYLQQAAALKNQCSQQQFLGLEFPRYQPTSPLGLFG